MRHQRIVVAGILCIGIALLVAGAGLAQQIITIPPNYYPFTISNDTWIATLENDYIRCNVGYNGTIGSEAFFDDDTVGGRGDKVFDKKSASHSWGVSGRYGIVVKKGDPWTTADDDLPLTFFGFLPCHYFAYWKLKIGNDIRMIGDGGTGGWYRDNQFSPRMYPTVYETPPPDLKNKEKGLGTTGPFMRAIWTTASSVTGSKILIDMRIHLVRDMVRFEYRITNKGTVSELVGFSQNGDVETGAPLLRTTDTGGFYGPYDNQNYAFMPGTGAAEPVGSQRAMIFGGYDPSSPRTLNPPVPDWFEIYDDVKSPVNGTRNVLGLEDATKPDIVAIGEYNDLYHKDMWVPTDYLPDMQHNILDMCWVLCWNQKPLAPGSTRTLVTYYGMASATSRWTYLVGKTPVRDSAVLAVEAPKSARFDSVSNDKGKPEISPAQFTVSAWVYNLATDPGPYDLRDATATINLPPGLILDPDAKDNEARKEIGMVSRNSESPEISWAVKATGDYTGELPMYVTVVDNDPTGKHWQQTVVRKIYVPATKRNQFYPSWQLMHVPFSFNNPMANYVFGRSSTEYDASYYDGLRQSYQPLLQLVPGQAFWMKIKHSETWKAPQSYSLVSDAAIVGESPGTGRQLLEQRIQLYKGWNMIGNPFVYPVYWGQVLVYFGDDTKTLDDAYSTGWINKTLFSYNTDKGDYDISSAATTLLDPWKGYWVWASRPVILVLRPPVFPGSDVMANPGGK